MGKKIDSNPFEFRQGAKRTNPRECTLWYMTGVRERRQHPVFAKATTWLIIGYVEAYSVDERINSNGKESMSWEILLNPIVIETLQYYDGEVVQVLLQYIEQELAKLPQPWLHADSPMQQNGLMTLSRTTLMGVVVMFVQCDSQKQRMKILHIQLRNNAYDQNVIRLE